MVLIGVFLCALVLFGTVDLDILKAWAVYMLSVMGVRAWIWYMFSKADRDSETVNRWEWLFAFGALLTGLGWGALLGPLYPGAGASRRTDVHCADGGHHRLHRLSVCRLEQYHLLAFHHSHPGPGHRSLRIDFCRRGTMASHRRGILHCRLHHRAALALSFRHCAESSAAPRPSPCWRNNRRSSNLPPWALR